MRVREQVSNGRFAISGKLIEIRAILVFLCLHPFVWAQDAPAKWTDPATKHTVIQLSQEPGSSSFYFHQNAYTASGDKMVISTPEGLASVDLHTWKMTPLVEGRTNGAIVGKKSRSVYYFKQDSIYATNIDTGATRLIVKNDELRSGSGLAINSDETLLAGSYVIGGRRDIPQAAPDAAKKDFKPPADSYPGKEDMMERRLAAHLPMGLFAIDTKTGEVKTFYRSTDWLGHVQFSPTDPTLLMFCHEGPWHKVDRIWNIRTDGSGLTLIHKRTMDMEIAGHEFWNPDGKIVWYDLQTPKGKEFWLAGVVLATGKKIRYRVERDQWSVHYNVSPDGKLFLGDGGGPNSVAAPGNGQWIYLFHPKHGALKAQKLVDLAKQDYKLEPNATLTPDEKWIIFRSNISGATQVYAVKVSKN
jgi:oligogalacturonide lyase